MLLCRPGAPYGHHLSQPALRQIPGDAEDSRRKRYRPTIIEYLKRPPDAKTLDGFLKKLGMEPRDLMRKGEAPYKKLGLKEEGKDRTALIAAMVENPILIERPIVVNGDTVALGRPPENVIAIL